MKLSFVKDMSRNISKITKNVKTSFFYQILILKDSSQLKFFVVFTL